MVCTIEFMKIRLFIRVTVNCDHLYRSGSLESGVMVFGPLECSMFKWHSMWNLVF